MIEFRHATEADLPAEHAAFVAAQEDLHRRRGAPWESRPFDPSGMWSQVHRHLLTHDGARSVVAEDAGQVAGFAAAALRGDFWYFAALFVQPRYQGRGVGKHLLDLAWTPEARRRATITEAIQPISNTVYARRGLLPVTPVLDLAGRPAADSRDGFLPGPTDTQALHLLDLAAYGFDRAVDHEFWARTSVRSTVWWREGEPAAYSYASPYGIGPVAGLDPASAAAALQCELARSAGDLVHVSVPGSSVELVKVAMGAGLRLSDPGLLLIDPADEGLPTALAIHSYWLL